MPQPGEIRRGTSESVQWDGSRWQPIDHVDASAAGGYHPGLDDSEHPWLARLKGFLSGASEAATPAKVGALGALATGVGAPVGAAILGAGGATAGLDLLRSHFQTPNAPQSGGDYLSDIATSAAEPAIAGAAGAGANALMKGGMTSTKAGMLTGGVAGAAEGYHRGGVSGALEGAATGAAGGGMLGKFTKLGKMLGMQEAAAPEVAAATAADEGGFAPGASASKAPEPWKPLNADLPDTSHFSKPAYDPQPVSASPSPVDRYMPNTGADVHPTLENDIPYPRQSNQSLTDSVVDRYAPNVSGYQPPATPKTTPASIEALMPEQQGQAGVGSLRTGAGLPGSAQPSELMTEPPFPDTHVYDSELGMSLPKNQQFDVVDGQNEFYGNRPEPTTEGQDIPGADDVERIYQSLQPKPAAAGPVAPTPAPRQVDRGDEFWGPGSTARTGAPAQADESSRLMYDPQTPTDYLRYQLQTATDPAEREFLAKSLSQRYRMQARPGKMASVRATPR